MAQRGVRGLKFVMRQRIAGAVLTACGLLLIAVATLRPGTGSAVATSPWCIACGTYATIDVVLNIALFVPAGVGLALLGVRPGPAIAMLLLATSCIELAQIRLVVGRDASLSDVIANTAGGALGILAAKHWRPWVVPRRGVAVALALVAALGWLAVLGVTAAAAPPSIPSVPFFAQRYPSVGVPGFDGRVLDVRINGKSLPLGPVRDVERIRSLLRAGPVWIDLSFLPGHPSPDVVPIARMSLTGVEAFAIVQRGTDLFFRIRRRANDLHLGSPALAIPGALRAGGAVDGVEPSSFRATIDRGVMVLDYAAEGRRMTARLRLTPSIGWMLFVPLHLTPATGLGALTAAWLIALALPLGFWTAAAGRAGDGLDVRSRRLATQLAALLIPLASIVVGFMVFPEVFDAAPPEWWEWAAAISGVILGALAAASARRMASNVGRKTRR